MTTEVMSVQSGGPEHGVVSIVSPYTFGDTVRRLLSVLADHDIKVFAVIDQQAEALTAGLAMPPTTLILFGNPKAGTPLMLARPRSGIDLPLKALVSESIPGQVSVSFNAAAYIYLQESRRIAENTLDSLDHPQLQLCYLGHPVT